MWNDLASRLATPLRRSLCALALGGLTTLAQSAVVQVINANEPGVGFNDPTPVLPVGGNAGTTLGQQRLVAFQYAANIWARTLKSQVPISVLATFEPLPCSDTSAVLGAAGAISVWSDFPGAEKPGTWYPSALANKLARQDIDPGPYPDGSEADIVAFFNSELGKAGCLAGSGYYLGLDSQVPAGQLDLITTLLHKLGHGLGFQNFSFGGVQLAGQPGIWDHFMYDVAARRTWLQMTEAERVASSIAPRNLVWAGEAVRSRAEQVLERGTPELVLHGHGRHFRGERSLMVGTASFGPPLSRRPVVQAMGQVVDQLDGTGWACTPLSAANIARVAGKVALVDRGGCTFTVKAANVQAAGAVAMVVVNNVAGGPPPDLGGTDPAIVIPAVRVMQEDGVLLKKLAGSNAVASLGLDMERLRGAAKGNRVLLYTPNPYAPGSSISHWDTSALRNLLMEPFDNPGMPHAVRAPLDLTYELLKDIGW